MKRVNALTLTILTLLLGACSIIIAPSEPEFSASNLTVDSNYVDDETGPYVCDEATTRVSYSFEYEGEIRRWSQALREYNPDGDYTERATYEEVVRPESSDAAVTGNTVSYEFTIDPRTALEPVDSAQVSPQQSINIVVDTRLRIEATGTDGQTEELIAEFPTRCLEE